MSSLVDRHIGRGQTYRGDKKQAPWTRLLASAQLYDFPAAEDA
jgi:hypothetical protein